MIENVLEFCDVASNIRAPLEDIILAAKTRRTRANLRADAIQAFELLAPKASPEILLGATKDFTRLDCDEQSCRAGIHVVRSYFAHLIRDMHRSEYGYRTAYSRDFDAMGIAVVRDFVDETLNKQVISEINKFPQAVAKSSSNIVAFNSDNVALNTVLAESRMQAIVFDCLGYARSEVQDLYARNTFVQKLKNVANDGDVQKVLHSDTFFPCIKWWYFPEEVKLEDGPFAYAAGSQIFTRAWAKFLYDQSIDIATYKIDAARTYGHAEGSLRIFDNELDNLGCTARPYVVPANSLVVANVYGFHRRSEVLDIGYRNAVHGSIRVNTPFS